MSNEPGRLSSYEGGYSLLFDGEERCKLVVRQVDMSIAGLPRYELTTSFVAGCFVECTNPRTGLFMAVQKLSADQKVQIWFQPTEGIRPGHSGWRLRSQFEPAPWQLPAEQSAPTEQLADTQPSEGVQ